MRSPFKVGSDTLRLNTETERDKDSNLLFYPDVDYSKSDLVNRIYRNTAGELIVPLTDKSYDNYIRKKEDALPEEYLIIENFPPSLAIYDAYRPEKAEDSLRELYKVAKAVPDKLVIAAAGNYKDDLREARKVLDVPENLLTVAELGSELYGDNYPRGHVFGADIYVENPKWQLDHGSSFSTPFISAYASVLFDKGLTLEQVKGEILAACENRTFLDEDNVENVARVFNPSKIQENILSLVH